jgi:hypothetical protein
MARPPSLRRPALQIMAREMRRIEKLQLAAEASGADYPLTEGDLEAVEAAAKVATLLERVKGDEEEKDEKAATPEDAAESLRRLEEKGPAKVHRGAGGETDDT